MPYKNREDARAYRRSHYAKNREKDLAQANAWNRAHPDRRKANKLKNRYGLTLEDREAMLAEQAGLCFLCRRRRAVCVDHDHSTGKVRRLLCYGCNGALGTIGEDVDLLRRMIEYVSATW